jgi:hypothetical protein
MVPPMAGTVPPYRGSLDSEIAALHSRARRKKVFTMLAFAAVLAVGYVQRDKLFALTAAAPAPEIAGIKVAAKQAGVKLVVDGKEMGMLPQELKDLTPGVHSLLFQGSDRYAPYKVDVNLGVNEVRELEPVQLKVAKGSATFDVGTPETTLTLVSGDERRALTDTSLPLDIDTSRSWTLEATKPGYKPLTIPLTFGDQAQKTFAVALEENKAPAAEAPAKAAESPATAPAEKAPAKHAAAPAPEPPAVQPAAQKRPQPAPEPPAPKAAAPQAAAATGNCKLNMNSIPISQITLDGKPIGTTPKIGIAVAPGTHSIMFVSDSGRKATTATCKAGEQKTVAVRL